MTDTTTNRSVAIQGPWHVDKYDALGIGVWRHVVKDAEGKIVAATYTPDNEARARLIAAAPELLAALHRLVTVYEEGDGACLDLRMADIARAAIAKAEGRDS